MSTTSRRPALPPQAELPTLRTPRLVLRPMTRADAPDVFAYASDPEVLRFTTGTTPARLADTEAFLDAALGDPETHMWAIARREQPTTAVGAIEFGTPGPAAGSVHYVLGRPHWGRGLMTEAVGVVCGWALATLPWMTEVVTAVVEGNVGSARVLEKCGFERIDLVEERWVKEPAPVRLLVYRLGRA